MANNNNNKYSINNKCSINNKGFANHNCSVMAHRGSRDDSTIENSLKAIEKAVYEKADLVEMDVRMTWDSEFIVFHDFILDRLTDWSGLASTKTLKILKKIKLKNGERIPTLDEVFCFIAKTKKERKSLKTKFVLDLKDLNTGFFDYDKMVRKIKKYGLEKEMILLSMNFFLLKKITKKYPEFNYCYFSWIPRRKALERAQSINAEYVGSTILTKKFIKKAHELNLKVMSLGTDSKWRLGWYLKNGVDVISTGRPAILRDLIKYYADKEKEKLQEKLQRKNKIIGWLMDKINNKIDSIKR